MFARQRASASGLLEPLAQVAQVAGQRLGSSPPFLDLRRCAHGRRCRTARLSLCAAGALLPLARGGGRFAVPLLPGVAVGAQRPEVSLEACRLLAGAPRLLL